MKPSIDQYIQRLLKNSPNVDSFRLWVDLAEKALWSGDISLNITGDTMGLSLLSPEYQKKAIDDIELSFDKINELRHALIAAIFLRYMVNQESQDQFSQEVKIRLDILDEVNKKRGILEKLLATSKTEILPKFVRLSAENYIRVSELTQQMKPEKEYFFQPVIQTRIFVKDIDGEQEILVFSLTTNDAKEIIRVLKAQVKISEKLYRQRDKISDVIKDE